MDHFSSGTAILLAAVTLLFALNVSIVLWMAGAFTKATPYHFGKLAELARGDASAREKVRKLRAQKTVTLRDAKICAREIEDMLDRKYAAQALARLGK